VTPNDVEDLALGANTLQNFPVQTLAMSGPTTSHVHGTLSSTASMTFAVEFFSNPACDGSGNGEGKTLLGSSLLTTDGSGDAPFVLVYSAAATPGHFMTATATDPVGNTSEFSACQIILPDSDDDGIEDAADNCPTTANPGQENNDGDPQGNACDNCLDDTNADQANNDGDALGDVCDPDDDNDGFLDISDACPFIPTAWMTPIGDADCDGFTSTDETTITTDPGDSCGFTAGAPTQSETWPPDLVETNSINISDVLALKPLFGTPGSARYDLVPSGSINISDVLALKPFFGKSCMP
jgi:hypothetical protein